MSEIKEELGAVSDEELSMRHASVLKKIGVIRNKQVKLRGAPQDGKSAEEWAEIRRITGHSRRGLEALRIIIEKEIDRRGKAD